MARVSYQQVGYDIVSTKSSKVYGGFTTALPRRLFQTDTHLHPLTGAAPRSRGVHGRCSLCRYCWPSTTAGLLSLCRLPETPYRGLSVSTLCTARHSALNVRIQLDTGVTPAARPPANLSNRPFPTSSNTPQ